MQNEHLEKKDFSIKSMFYEFMKHKANEVNSGTVKRMMADWTRFYEPENDIVNIGCQYHYTKPEDSDRWLSLTGKAKGIIKRIEAVNEEYGHKYEDFLFVRNSRCLTPDAVDTQITRC